MGLSSSKTTTKPVYSAELTGAAGNVTSAYNAAAPKVAGVTDQLSDMAPSLVSRFTNGDPTINAAQGYNTRVLSGDYLGQNPFLDQIVGKSNDAVRNGVAASMGTRGLTGGSAMTDIMSRAIADNTTNLYGRDYDSERSRMSGAAGQAPSLAAAQNLPISALIEIAQAQQMPLQAAAGYGSTIGGLLGNYTQTKSSPGLGAIIGQLGGAALSGWAGTGFK